MSDDLNLWNDLRRLTAARIGLQRAGASLATASLLEFKLAHARARDAVHEPLDAKRLVSDLGGAVEIASAASDRPSYLMRPDLGRQLRRRSAEVRRSRRMPANTTWHLSSRTVSPARAV